MTGSSSSNHQNGTKPARTAPQSGWALTDLFADWKGGPDSEPAASTDAPKPSPLTFRHGEFTPSTGNDVWDFSAVIKPSTGLGNSIERLFPDGKAKGTVVFADKKVKEFTLNCGTGDKDTSHASPKIALRPVSLTVTPECTVLLARLHVGGTEFDIKGTIEGSSWYLSVKTDKIGKDQKQIRNVIKELTGRDSLPWPDSLEKSVKSLPLSIKGVGIHFEPSLPPKLNSIEISVGVNREVKPGALIHGVAENAIVLSEVSFTIWAYFGFQGTGGGSSKLIGYGGLVSGLLDIGKLKFGMFLFAPHYEFDAVLLTPGCELPAEGVIPDDKIIKTLPNLADVLADILPGSNRPKWLDRLKNITVEELSLSIAKGYFSFRVEVGSECSSDGPIQFFGGRLDIECLERSRNFSLSLSYEVASTVLILSGTYSSSSGTDAGLTLAGALRCHRDSPLTVGELVAHFNSDWRIPDELKAVEIEELAGSVTFGGVGGWSFSCDVAWKPDELPFAIAADVAIRKEGGASAISGTVLGRLLIGDMVFNVVYAFGKAAKQIDVELKLGGFELMAKLRKGNLSLRWPANPAKKDVPLVDLLDAIAEHIVPGTKLSEKLSGTLGEALKQINLKSFGVTVNTDAGAVSFECTIIPKEIAGVNIKGFGMVYRRKGGKSSLQATLSCDVLGRSFSPDQGNALSWDAMSQTTPPMPNPAILDVRFLAVGRRIAIGSDVPRTVEAGIELYRTKLLPPKKNGTSTPPGPAVALGFPGYDGSNGFLFALEATVKSTVSVSVLFRDPDFYGAKVVLKGERAGKLAGLGFELSYRRLSDNIGVFHGTFIVPDNLRRMDLGRTVLTIGEISADVYTNGDFSVDLGFPANGDFSRSFAIDLPTWSGRGGFLLERFSGSVAANALIPKVGRFDPILRFGIGLTAGTRKEFSWGPLKGSVTVGLTAMLDGYYAAFIDENDKLTNTPYYRVVGVAAMTGHIEGEIDLEVLSVRVSVAASAAVTMILESFAPTTILFRARVAASASVRIGFISIDKSFDMDASIDLSFGERQTPPWIKLMNDPPALPERKPSNQTDSQISFKKRFLKVEIMPVETWSGSDKAVVLMPILNMEDREHGFPALVRGILEWMILLVNELPFFTPIPLSNKEDLEKTVAYLNVLFKENCFPQSNRRFNGGKLVANVIATEFNSFFNVQTYPVDLSASVRPSRNWVAFTIIPNGQFLEASTWEYQNNIPLLYRDMITPVTSAWKDRILVARGAALEKKDPVQIAQNIHTLFFRDYVVTVMREVAKYALEWYSRNEASKTGDGKQAVSVEEIFSSAIEPQLHRIAGMVSACMMGGARIPHVAGSDADLWPYTVVTRQQMSLNTGISSYQLSVPTVIGHSRISAHYPRNHTLPWPEIELDPRSPEVQPPRRSCPFAFALAKARTWQSGPRFGFGNAVSPGPVAEEKKFFTLREFPRQFLQHLPDLDRWPADGFDLRRDGVDLRTASWAWASLVPLTLRRTAMDSIAVLCPAQEPDRDRLLALWQDVADPGGWMADLFLLYARKDDPVQLVSIELDRDASMILQTGLSTLTVADPLPSATVIAGELADRDFQATEFSAPMAQPSGFIRMVWRAATTGGGFLLRCLDRRGQGFPPELFAKGDESTIWLLAVAQDNACWCELRDFHNVMIGHETAAEAALPLIVTPVEKVGLRRPPQCSLPTLPPGYVGLTVRRDIPGRTARLSDDQVRAQTLFSLLGVRLESSDKIRKGPEPIPETPATMENDPSKWVYNPVVRVAPYVLQSSIREFSIGLPDLADDPYRGIAEGAEAKLKLSFFDGFGNELAAAPNSENPRADIKHITLKYSDNLIGPGQWPGLIWGYHLGRSDPQGPGLTIQVFFNHAEFDRHDKIERAIELYRAVYYQIMQPGISLEVRCSLEQDGRCSASWRTPAEEEFLRKLVNLAKNAYLYLKAAQQADKTSLPYMRMNPNNDPLRPLAAQLRLMPDYSKATVPMEVEVVLKRPKGQFHPDFPASGCCVDRVPPWIHADSPEAGLSRFTKGFAEVLGDRFALALGRSKHGRRSFVAVNLEKAGLGPGRPKWDASRRFAVPPLAVPRGGIHVAVQGLNAQTGLPDGPVSRIVADAEMLERAARHLFATLERCLSPDRAGATLAYNDQAYTALMQAKRLLADGLAERLIELDGNGLCESGRPTPALSAARERFRQELLADISRVHSLELMLQVPVTLSSGFGAKPGGPREFIRWKPNDVWPNWFSCKTPDGDKIGWRELQKDWGATVAAMSALLADIPNLLNPGAKIAWKHRSAVVEPGMTLRGLLACLGGPSPGDPRIALLKAPDGLFKGGTPVPLVRRNVKLSRRISFKDLLERENIDAPLHVLVLNLRSVPGIVDPSIWPFAEKVSRAPGGGAAADLDDWAKLTGYATAHHLVADHLSARCLKPETTLVVLKPVKVLLQDLNVNAHTKRDQIELLADVPGLLLPNGEAEWNGARVMLTRRMTLRQLSIRLGMSSLDDMLTTGFVTRFGLFNPGVELPPMQWDCGTLRLVRPIPEAAGRVNSKSTARDADTSLPTFGPAKLSLGNGTETLDVPVYRTAARTAAAEVQELKLTIEQMEHDIMPVDDSHGYVASHWLHFLQPIVHDLGRHTLTLPHAAAPATPLAIGHNMISDRTGAGSTWDYAAEFRIVPQVNERYWLQIGFGSAAEATNNDSAWAALAQYDVLAPQMDSVLAALGGPLQEGTRLPDALDTLARIAGKVARNWNKPATGMSGDVLQYKISVGGTADRVTSLTIIGKEPPDITWDDPRFPKTVSHRQENRDAETWEIPIDWPADTAIDLHFTWRHLDLFDRPDALTALSVSSPTPVDSKAGALAEAFAVTHGPASFPTPVAAERRRPDSAFPRSGELRTTVHEAIQTLFGGTAAIPACRLAITINHMVTLGGIGHLRAETPVASATEIICDAGALAKLVNSLVSQTESAFPKGAGCVRASLRLHLWAYSLNRKLGGPPVLRLCYDVT
ncbi:hypothetical protein [Azospirillum sp. sgz302134]